MRAPDFFGHPRGLAYLAFTEMWERFSFYGMRALLLLYMVDVVLQPDAAVQVWGLSHLHDGLTAISGPLSTQAFASLIFAIYAGFVYFTPPLGGLIADRLFGQRRTVMLGACMMAAGHVLMAFNQSFLIALLLLIIGGGCLKGNITAQVGALYGAEDTRRSRAYAVFNVGINVGAIFGPLLCGLLAQIFGWEYGFGAAAIGMMLGLAAYVYGARYLPARASTSRQVAAQRLGPREWRIVAALIAAMGVEAFFITTYAQKSNALFIWIRETTTLNVSGFTVPIAWFTSLDGLVCVLFTPVVLWIWRRTERSDNAGTELRKIAMGSVIGASGSGLLALGSLFTDAGPLGVGWAAASVFLTTIGFLYTWPPLLALVSRLAPPSVNGTMMGIAFLTLFTGNILAGVIARYYESMPHIWFWLLHAAIACVGGVLALLLGRRIERWVVQ